MSNELTPREKPAGPRDKDSVVYFIEYGEFGPIKIGRAVSPGLRLQYLQIGVPVSLAIIGVIPFSSWTESQVHERFRDIRIRGEWFQRTPELLAFIDKHGFLACDDDFRIADLEPDDLRILRGIRPSQERSLRQAGISTISALQAAIDDGRLARVRGVGPQAVAKFKTMVGRARP